MNILHKNSNSDIISKKLQRVLMTYGEYYYLVKYDMKLVSGNWVANTPKIKIPRKMSRDESSLYYTLKFREYWKSLN